MRKLVSGLPSALTCEPLSQSSTDSNLSECDESWKTEAESLRRKGYEDVELRKQDTAGRSDSP